MKLLLPSWAGLGSVLEFYKREEQDQKGQQGFVDWTGNFRELPSAENKVKESPKTYSNLWASLFSF